MKWIESSSSISYLFHLSCMNLDMHKKPQKIVLFYGCSIYVDFSWTERSGETSVKLCYRKKRILVFFPSCRESIHFSDPAFFLKRLQLVRARNRPILRLFFQFLAESNSHQYGSTE